jgi:hypothetical protein
MHEDFIIGRLFTFPDIGQVLVLPDLHVTRGEERPHGILVRCAHPYHTPQVHLCRPGAWETFDPEDDYEIGANMDWALETMATFSAARAYDTAKEMLDALDDWDHYRTGKPTFIEGI